jgi:hypothetical protein
LRGGKAVEYAAQGVRDAVKLRVRYGLILGDPCDRLLEKIVGEKAALKNIVGHALSHR